METSSLGNNTGIASMPAPRQKLRYTRRNLARRLLPDERIKDCGRAILPNSDTVTVKRSASGTAFFGNLCVCGSVWGCACCAARISEERRREMLTAISKGQYVRIMVTYTLRHNKGDRLTDLITGLRESYRALKSGAEWQEIKESYSWVGSVSSSEITYGDNGWHPHIHELVLLDRAKLGADNPSEIEGEARALEEWLKERWIRVLARFDHEASYEHGVDVRVGDDNIAEYVEKWGHEPADVGWTIDRELTKSSQKIASRDGHTPLQLLDAYGQGDEKAGALFREYYYAMKGRNQLVWSRGLRELLGLKEQAPSDEALADPEPETGEAFTTIHREQWRMIINNPVRDELGRVMADVRGKPMFQDISCDALQIASIGSVDYFWEWLYAHGVPQVEHVDLRDPIPPKPTPPMVAFGVDYDRRFKAYERALAEWNKQYGKV